MLAGIFKYFINAIAAQHTNVQDEIDPELQN